MEVVLDRDAFLKGLQMVQNIVEPRQTLPILANVLARGRGRERAADRDRSRGRRAGLGSGAGGDQGRDHGGGAQACRDRQRAARRRRSRCKVGDNAGGEPALCGGDLSSSSGWPPDDFPPVVPASPAAVDHPRGQGPAGDAHADELRHLPRRNALCPERRAVLDLRARRSAWSRPTAIGWPCRHGRLGQGEASRRRASCRAKRSPRSCASWARAKRSRSRSPRISSCSRCRISS